jgi:hypothetical protein
MRYFIILLILLSSCSSRWHLKRAIKKDPTIVQVDTIMVTDSVHVVTPFVSTDTIFKLSKDTITIVKDRLTMRHYYHNDSVYLYGECESDTIVKWKTFEVQTEKVVYNEPWFPRWMWIIIAIFALTILIIKIK